SRDWSSDVCSSDLAEIAEANGLDYIETTSERNGYPSNIKSAIIGFDSFEQAQELANTYGLSIESFEKRDGWALWYRTGNSMYEEFTNSVEDYGDNYMEYAPMEREEFYEQEIKEILSDFDSWEDLSDFLSRMESIWEEIEKLEDNEVVIAHEGRYYDTISTKSMSFYHDTKHYAIGLINRK